MITRLKNIDYLRGVLCLNIVVYHYLTWSQVDFSAETLMYKFGVYGVSTFYMISGLTLFTVYFDSFQFTKKEILLFFKRRFLRIYPLFWVAIIATLLLNSDQWSTKDLILNFTGLFGFVSWDTYIATGTYSIGNEITFYTIFIGLIYILKKNKVVTIVFGTLLLLIFLYFTFFKFNVNFDLKSQWGIHSNPLFQLFYFFCGILMGYLFQNIEFKKYTSLFLFIAAILIFVFYPMKEEKIFFVSGINRLILTFSSVILLLSFYKTKIKTPALFDLILNFLGEKSYTIYLLHPLVYILLSKVLVKFNLVDFDIIYRILISIFLTLFLSHFVFKYYEKYFIRLGKK